jgi:hypothetical protein
MLSEPASAPVPAKSSPQRHDREQADQADDDDDGLDDTTGDVAERERLALPLDDGPQHDGGSDVRDGEEDLAERAQLDARVGPVAEDVIGVVEDRVVEEQPCNRGDEGQGEQHAEDACALLLLGRRHRHFGSWRLGDAAC